MIPIGAWMIGHLRCRRSVSALAGHMVPPALGLYETIPRFARRHSEALIDEERTWAAPGRAGSREIRNRERMSGRARLPPLGARTPERLGRSDALVNKTYRRATVCSRGGAAWSPVRPNG